MFKRLQFHINFLTNLQSLTISENQKEICQSHEKKLRNANLLQLGRKMEKF